MDIYQQIIHKSRYARWDGSRREDWSQTVRRCVGFLEEQSDKMGYKLDPGLRNEIETSILNMDVMPSMRLMMTAGDAVRRENVCAYNCAYIAIRSKRAFSELMYCLMNGTGVGFSVERQFVGELPAIPWELSKTKDVIVVGDSKEGWARAFNKLITSLYEGDIPAIDYSKIRPAGSRLKTFGGRASGPEPLERLFEFVIRVFSNAKGRKLNSLEVHDICCMIGEVVVVGGVRRSALLSLSNLTDQRMRTAKSGNWYDRDQAPYRRLANNSVCYTEVPDPEIFLEEWLSLLRSKSGERGIFNRQAAIEKCRMVGRSHECLFGTNPCSEIILRDREFCNLSEVVIRDKDSALEIKEKIRIATIIGTIQSTLTDFHFLSEQWKHNCDEERLLGVSLTGIFDNNSFVELAVGGETFLEGFRVHARDINRVYAEKLGVNPSAAITCIKPSGTVSQLVNCSSGIHPRYSKFYIRTIRMDRKDPLTDFLISQGIPHEADVMAPAEHEVFYFPQRSPESIFDKELSAIAQLNIWLQFNRNWCEHKPSITVYYKPDEALDVASFVYRNFNEMSGVSFLPRTGHVYKQAPYTECTEEEYKLAVERMPKEINWESFTEEDDYTTASQELACSGNQCEV